MTDAEVVDVPDVEAAQLEHQVHLGGPAVDAAYGDELAISSSSLRADVRVRTTVPSRTLAERSRIEASLFADRPAARSAGSGVAATVAGVDASPTVVRSRPWIACAPSCQLLVDDGEDERAEGAVRVAWAMADRSDACDELSAHRIACDNLGDRGLERCPHHT